MSKHRGGIAIFVSFLMLTAFSTATFGQGSKPKNLRRGGVYVLTNQVVNQVAAFRRTAKGILTFADMFPTGGAGDPVPKGTDPAMDPLASQGALIMSPGTNHHLKRARRAGEQNALMRVGICKSKYITPTKTVDE
jgi:hypothetical protein